MNRRSFCVAAAGMLAVCAGHAQTRPNINWGGPQATIPNLAPVGTPPPQAYTWYEAGWSLDDAGGAPGQGGDWRMSGPRVRYCVRPSIRVTGPGTWTTRFSVSLVDAKGRAALLQLPDTRALPVAVGVDIPADTTLTLEPVPQWCGVAPGARKPPELYLQVDGRRARVVFPTTPTPMLTPKADASTR